MIPNLKFFMFKFTYFNIFLFILHSFTLVLSLYLLSTLEYKIVDLRSNTEIQDDLLFLVIPSFFITSVLMFIPSLKFLNFVLYPLGSIFPAYSYLYGSFKLFFSQSNSFIFAHYRITRKFIFTDYIREFQNLIRSGFIDSAKYQNQIDHIYYKISEGELLNKSPKEYVHTLVQEFQLSPDIPNSNILTKIIDGIMYIRSYEYFNHIVCLGFGVTSLVVGYFIFKNYDQLANYISEQLQFNQKITESVSNTNVALSETQGMITEFDSQLVNVCDLNNNSFKRMCLTLKDINANTKFLDDKLMSLVKDIQLNSENIDIILNTLKSFKSLENSFESLRTVTVDRLMEYKFDYMQLKKLVIQIVHNTHVIDNDVLKSLKEYSFKGSGHVLGS